MNRSTKIPMKNCLPQEVETFPRSVVRSEFLVFLLHYVF